MDVLAVSDGVAIGSAVGAAILGAITGALATGFVTAGIERRRQERADEKERETEAKLVRAAARQQADLFRRGRTGMNQCVAEGIWTENVNPWLLQPPPESDKRLLASVLSDDEWELLVRGDVSVSILRGAIENRRNRPLDEQNVKFLTEDERELDKAYRALDDFAKRVRMNPGDST